MPKPSFAKPPELMLPDASRAPNDVTLPEPPVGADAPIDLPMIPMGEFEEKIADAVEEILFDIFGV